MHAERQPDTAPATPERRRGPILPAILNPFGRFGIRLNNTLGAMAIFLGRAVVQIFHYKQIPEIINQVYFIGAKSASIVALVGFFTGMVLGLQLYYVMNKFGAVGFLGTAVALSLIRELGPVLTAIMITARAGSAMTAEIGIQRISEQIDALTTMRIDALGYLISPRIAAALISFPILTAVFDLIGILGGYLRASNWPISSNSSWAPTPAPTSSASTRASTGSTSAAGSSSRWSSPSWSSRSAASRGTSPTCAGTATGPRASASRPPRPW